MGELTYTIRRFFKSDMLAFYVVGVVVLMLLAWSVVAATRHQGAEFDRAKPGEKVLRVDGNVITTIDPRYHTGTFITQQALFEGLVEFTRDHHVAPAAAERWDVSPDLLTYTFHLRHDRRWSNGDPVTAEDFRYAWIRVANPRIAGATWWWNSGLRFIAGFTEYGLGSDVEPDKVAIHALDPWTLQVRLKAPQPDFPDSLLHPTCLPVPSKVVQDCDARGVDWTLPGNFVCNGPYVVQKWLFNSSMSLIRNPYWTGERGNLDRIVLLLNAAGGVTAFENHEVDVTPAGGIPDIRYAQRKEKLRRSFVAAPTSTSHYLVPLKTQHPLMYDVRFRRALAMAVDLPKIIGTVARDVYVPQLDQVPPFMATNKERGLRYDPQEARRLLAEAGCPGGRGCPPIHILLPAQGPPLITILAGIKEDWERNLGVTVKLENMEWGVWAAANVAIQPPGYLGFTYNAGSFLWNSELESIRRLMIDVLPFWDMPEPSRTEFWNICTDNAEALGSSARDKEKAEEKKRRIQELGAKIQQYRTEKVGPTCRWLQQQASKIALERDAARREAMLDEALTRIDEEAWIFNFTTFNACWLIRPNVKGVVLNPFLGGTITYYRWIDLEDEREADHG